jgi:hypothetical protein
MEKLKMNRTAIFLVAISIALTGCDNADRSQNTDVVNTASELSAANTVSVMIADKEPKPILFKNKNKDCSYQADALSKEQGVIEFRLNSVRCGSVVKEINTQDNAPALYFKGSDIIRSGMVVGVVNEMSIGTKIDGTKWLRFEKELSNYSE